MLRACEEGEARCPEGLQERDFGWGAGVLRMRGDELRLDGNWRKGGGGGGRG